MSSRLSLNRLDHKKPMQALLSYINNKSYWYHVTLPVTVKSDLTDRYNMYALSVSMFERIRMHQQLTESLSEFWNIYYGRWNLTATTQISVIGDERSLSS